MAVRSANDQGAQFAPRVTVLSFRPLKGRLSIFDQASFSFQVRFQSLMYALHTKSCFATRMLHSDQMDILRSVHFFFMYQGFLGFFELFSKRSFSRPVTQKLKGCYTICYADLCNGFTILLFLSMFDHLQYTFLLCK